MDENLFTHNGQSQASTLQPAKRSNVFVTLAFVAAIVAIVLQLFSSLLYIHAFWIRADHLGMQWTPYLISCVEQSLVALLLPTVALTMHRSSKHRMAKFFVVVSIVFLALQLIAAIISAIHMRGGIDSIFVNNVANSISGSRFLRSMYECSNRLFNGALGNLRAWSNFFYSLVTWLVGFCFIAKHVFCMIGFIKISKTK